MTNEVKQVGASAAIVTSVIVALFASAVHAHQGHEHHHTEAKLPPSEESLRQAAFQRIGKAYEEQVRPAFRKACFDCHSSTPRYPWYYKIPGAKQLIDHDIAESKEHLDFTNGYPFKSHATREEDLQAIADVISDGSMPPFRYRAVHPKEKLTSEEKDAILKWAKESAALLAQKTAN